MLFVEKGAIEGIQYDCKRTTDYTSANGIRCEDEGEKIFHRFGKSVTVLCPRDKDERRELRRAYAVPEFGVQYLMKRNRVKGFYVTDKSRLAAEAGGNWIACT